MHANWRPHVFAVLAYAVLAIAFSWPLSTHLSTHLTGPLDSDTAVYVWNQWVFHHELVENRTLPYFTETIFSLTPRANLSLHNYTTFANLLALPLISWLGVVATFNVVFLAQSVLTAYAMYLLARDLTRGANTEAWLAGALFAWCPLLVTRGGGHFSLAAAAPLPIFALLLLKTPHKWTARSGIALGVAMAWAATSDAYYGVFCLVLAAVVLSSGLLQMRRAKTTMRSVTLAHAIDVLIVLLVGLAAAIVISRGWRITFLGRAVSFRSLYTPVFVLTVLVLLRGAIRYRPALMAIDANGLRRFMWVSTATLLVCTASLSPVLYALGHQIAEGRYPGSLLFWRSSPPGVDLAAFLLPNPNHPWAPEGIRLWLNALRNGYLENAASISLVALAVLAIAWTRGWRPPRVWTAIAGAFMLLALGPFVHVAGANTYVPGPWALARYLPIVGLARSPGRFVVILMLAIAALFAIALAWLTAPYPQRRRMVLTIVGTLLAFELLPVPRPIYDATVPSLYARVAADPRPDVRVLELPFGVRDGTRSVGNFTGRSQFFQTFHHKPLLGGYLSRVSRRRVEETRRYPMLDAFISLSEGRTISEDTMRTLEARGPTFARRAQVGYVVIDRMRASPQLIAFAIRVLRLELVERVGALELYKPLL